MGKGKKKGGKGGGGGATGAGGTTGEGTGGGGDASDNKPVQSGSKSVTKSHGAGGDSRGSVTEEQTKYTQQQQSGHGGDRHQGQRTHGQQQTGGPQQSGGHRQQEQRSKPPEQSDFRPQEQRSQPPPSGIQAQQQRGMGRGSGRQPDQRPHTPQQPQGPSQPQDPRSPAQPQRGWGRGRDHQPDQRPHTPQQPQSPSHPQEQRIQAQQQRGVGRGSGRQPDQRPHTPQQPQGPSQPQDPRSQAQPQRGWRRRGDHQPDQRSPPPQQPQGPSQPQEQRILAQQQRDVGYGSGRQPDQRSHTPQQPQGPSHPQEQIYQTQQQRDVGHGGGRQQQQQQSQPQPQYQQSQQYPSQSTPERQMPTESRVSPKKGAGDQSGQKFTARAILNLSEQMKQMNILQKKEIIPGGKGKKILIETNHLSLNLGKLLQVYHFDVQITPDTPKKYLRPVMDIFRSKHFPKNYPAFDGRKNLYSPYMLVKEGQPLTDEISIQDNDRQRVYKVQVQYANAVDLRPLHQRITMLSPQEAIQVVEIVLRSAPATRCIQAGRSFFTKPQGIIDLGEGMEMYHGFYESVVRGWKPLLNVDVAHKAFPKEINIIDLIIELCSSYYDKITRQDLASRPLTVVQSGTLSKFLFNLRIMYEIRGQPGSRREHRVNGIGNSPRDTKFRPDNGPQVTVEDYFKTKKNFRLQYPLMPTIWVGKKDRPDKILLPAELCTVVPGQAVNRKMTENQTSSMIKYAATSTDVRKQKIMTSLENTRHNEDLCIREFGFSIGSGFEKVTARVLDPPPLGYNNEKTITPQKGVWRSDRMMFLKPAEIKSWTIISAVGPNEGLSNLANMISASSRDCGINLGPKPTQPEVLRGRTPTYRDIETALKKYQTCDLVFVVIPDSGPTYSNVKKAAELNIGCLTQCLKRRTLNKLNPATVGNILLKINSKMNGTNHCLSRRPRVLDRPCMIMGADVTHPSPDSQNIPSVAAVTASHDPKAFCYNICCRLQDPKVEIISDLQDITREHLLYFYKSNAGQKPQRIIFFRDGVSEGQFIDVLRTEVSAIRKACSLLEKDYQPKITFLVVQKRHHTRFFPTNKKDSDDRNFNVPAGTCVDTNITNPEMQDFYLVSHASIQGVAKPTKYCTLWDDNDMNNDEIEELTYHLCHLFTRCNRSVSYPAPTYYAHLAAARAKVYIENENIDLNNLQREQKRISILDIIRKNKPMFFV